VWGGGWLNKQGVRDFAGGLVVHATAGSSALVFALLLGKRQSFPTHQHPPHSPVLVMIGAGLLWVGWYGFNAGSALAANASAGSAMLATHLSASTAALVWMGIEWAKFGRPGLVGTVTGLVAGLATITPAAGSVGPAGAIVIGAAASVVCFTAVTLIRGRLKIDDSLDVFAVHGVGGILGTLLVAVLATKALGGAGYAEGMGMGSQLGVQALGVVATVIWSALATVAIVLAVRPVFGLRATDIEIEDGLDLTQHGERAFTP
jgi:Amt family ammonium transporter